MNSNHGLTGRLEWLDAMRGLAILGVVAVHSGQAANATTGFVYWFSSTGQYGVQLFFIVSAITISLSYNSHIKSVGNQVRHALPWLTKRFFRIAPLYYLAIVLYAAEQLYVRDVPPDVFNIIANVAFLHTWIPRANNTVVPGGWSIGVEMFFYLLVPLIWKLPRRNFSLLTIAAIALVLSHIARYAAHRSLTIENNSFLYLWFPTQLPVTAIGLVFYSLVIERREPVSVSAAAFSFIVLFTCGSALGTGLLIAPGVAPTIFGLTFSALIASLKGRRNRILVNTATILLGRVSYSVYIFHFIILDAIKELLSRSGYVPDGSAVAFAGIYVSTLLVVSLVALASKWIIEDPGIRLGHKLSAALIQKISC
jgi:peptidoglycan/LPS O-acetylase OafA/YrhL